MTMTSRILLGIAGIALIAFSSLIYEDEELIIQNILENWWIGLDDRRIRSLRKEQVILSKAASRVTRMLNIWFGQETLSAQVIVVSACQSIIINNLSIWIHFLGQPMNLLGKLYLWPSMIGALLAIVLARRTPNRRLANWICFFVSISFCSFTGMQVSGDYLHTLLANLIALVMSLCTDVLMVLILKKFMRYSESATLTKIAVASMLCLAAIFCLFEVPILIIYDEVNNFPNLERSFLVQTAEAVGNLNVSDAIAIALLLVAIGVMFLHHLWWTLFQRPLYFIQRTGILKARKYLQGAGLSMVLLGLGWTSLADGIKKYLGK